MSNTSFGRRGAAPATNSKAEAPKGTPAPSGQPLTFGEIIRSPLMVQLGGMLCGVLLLLSFIGIYVGIMKGAGRALEASWNRKTIGPVERVEPQIDPDPDLAELSRRPCNVRSFNPEFQRLQRELGC
jgi:hypothetical protein